MGHITEPKGVDLIIQSPPLSLKEKKELSEFIKKRKAKTSKLLGKNKSRTPKKVPSK